MQLTERETQILTRLLDGQTNKQIAINLGISSYTVRDHISNMMRKFQVPTRCALAALYAHRCAKEELAEPPHTQSSARQRLDRNPTAVALHA
jgi:DNA-binding CsgD family transcriptional regulator